VSCAAISLSYAYIISITYLGNTATLLYHLANEIYLQQLIVNEQTTLQLPYTDSASQSQTPGPVVALPVFTLAYSRAALLHNISVVKKTLDTI